MRGLFRLNIVEIGIVDFFSYKFISVLNIYISVLNIIDDFVDISFF